MNTLRDSKIKSLLEKAKEQGFDLLAEKGGKHFKLSIPGSKRTLTIPGTTSDCNYYWELRRNLRKNGYIEQ